MPFGVVSSIVVQFFGGLSGFRLILTTPQRRDWRQHDILAKAQNIFLPLLFECSQISSPQNLLQTLIARGILFLMAVKLPVEFYEQTTLLQVITKVTRLTIVCAFIFVVEALRVERCERLEFRDLARFDCRL